MVATPTEQWQQKEVMKVGAGITENWKIKHWSTSFSLSLSLSSARFLYLQDLFGGKWRQVFSEGLVKGSSFIPDAGDASQEYITQ